MSCVRLSKHRCKTVVAALILVGIVGVQAWGVGAAIANSTSTSMIGLTVLSNRADLISGGDALVEVTTPDDAKSDEIRIALDGRDVTHEFALRPNGRYVGLVTGLRPGTNELTAESSNSNGVKLTITNHSKQGPVLSGKQVQPWICETAKYGLEPATGPACIAPTRYDYFYRSAVTNQFETYNPASPPAGALVKSTTTDRGITVPYIVRRERGVINRGIYDIAVLYQPGQAWEPWAPQAAWNGKLYWIFEGGWSPGHRQGGEGPVDVLNGTLSSPADFPLARGFAVASSTLLIGNNNSNDIVAAEALMMVKEHLIETYGPVRYSMSNGNSGGSAMERLIAANYPGLLDGITTTWSVPDAWTIFRMADECLLLTDYFNGTAPELWIDPLDRRAVTGLGGISCEGWLGLETAIQQALDPRFGCTTEALVPGETFPGGVTQREQDWAYDPQTNPDGVRCTIQDHQAPAFGYRTADGFARRPLDTSGVEYGLVALTRGEITAEQFVDLNVKLGGRDIDYNWRPQRTEGDLEAVSNAYRSGRVPDYRQLAKVPIMDLRPGANAEWHQSIHTEMARARLLAANGHADNQVSWESVDVMTQYSHLEMIKSAFLTLDQWLAGIEGDRSDASLETKVLRHKPSQAKDACWVGDEAGACGNSLPDYPDPRMQAGGPLTSDVHKCRLAPIDWSGYGTVEFTDQQKELLRAAFPDGVCDWTKPGIGQQPANGPWQSFMTTVGGKPLGPAPRSEPVSGAR